MNLQKDKIVFAGNGSYLNRGCEAIVRGTTAILDRFIENPVYYSAYFSESGFDDRESETDNRITHLPIRKLERHSLDWFEYQLIKRTNTASRVTLPQYRFLEQHIRESCFVLMLGGDNYSLDYGKPDDFFAMNRLCEKIGVPSIIWGASVGPFSVDKKYERKAARELRKVTRIYVRETASLKYLQEIGVIENVRLSADPSFWLEPKPVEVDHHIETMLSNGCAGLNLSPLLGQYISNTQTSWMEKATEIVQECSENIPYPLLLIPHVTSKSGLLDRDDFCFLESIYLKLHNKGNKKVFLLGNNYNAAETKWIISRLVAFAGARTHSTFAALSTSVPTLSIGYSIKALGINKDIFDSEDWLIKREELSSSFLTGKMNECIKHSDEIKVHLNQVIPVFRERALSSGVDLLTLID